jgi:hypothetical protein
MFPKLPMMSHLNVRDSDHRSSQTGFNWAPLRH